ncbi:Sec-independent protein translocase subunit TatA [Streptomyces sp. NPDC057403]|uniref:Sec-independent protein translocase subunit TatA n=1 Tax=Streptomyces sp. NPDC057403 TaxID=3346119 RepID=UPI0036C13C84
MLRNGLEPWHLLVVAIVIIVLFGSKKLPDAARGLGKSMRILKSEAKAMKDDDVPQAAAPTDTAPQPSAAKVIPLAAADTDPVGMAAEDTAAR